MSDLTKYIEQRKKSDKEFSINFDSGYQAFKIGLFLKEARKEAGITQEELAIQLKTKKSAISRIENHAEDVKLSTLEKFARSLGKSLEVRIY